MSDDSIDYSFMRSGFNTVQEVVNEEETKKNAISLIVAYSEGALCSAGKYVTHGKRTVVTPEDLKRGMMLEMFLFKRRDDILEKANQIKEELFNTESDDETDDMDLVEECDDFKESDCNCALCKCMNAIYTRWDSWEPDTEFERIFQKHINDMN